MESEIPLAVVGIIMKVNMIFMSIIIGIAQGLQPISSFNYGAQKYGRVRRDVPQSNHCGNYYFHMRVSCVPAVSAPDHWNIRRGRRGISILRNAASVSSLLFTFVNGIQPVTSNFFSSIGKATKGIWLSLTRQIIFLLPLVLILPVFLGIDGVMYAGPVADSMAALAAILLVTKEMKNMKQLEYLQAS